MDKKEFISDLENNVYCRLQKSNISGVGVFAIRNIKKGTNPFNGKRVVTYTSVPLHRIMGSTDIHENVKKLMKDMYVIKANKVYAPDHGLNEVDVSYFINHSSDSPNMEERGSGFAFYTKRDIEAGEEVTVAYATYNH